MLPRKPDTRFNPDGVSGKVEEAKKRDKNKTPVRINRYTVVLR